MYVRTKRGRNATKARWRGTKLGATQGWGAMQVKLGDNAKLVLRSARLECERKAGGQSKLGCNAACGEGIQVGGQCKHEVQNQEERGVWLVGISRLGTREQG